MIVSPGPSLKRRQSGCLINYMNRAAAPGIVEGYALDIRNNIDAKRRIVPRAVRVGFGQFVGGYVGKWRTKCR